LYYYVLLNRFCFYIREQFRFRANGLICVLFLFVFSIIATRFLLTFLQRNFNLRSANGIDFQNSFFSECHTKNIQTIDRQKIMKWIIYGIPVFDMDYIISCDSETLFIIIAMRLYRKFISHCCTKKWTSLEKKLNIKIVLIYFQFLKVNIQSWYIVCCFCYYSAIYLVIYFQQSNWLIFLELWPENM